MTLPEYVNHLPNLSGSEQEITAGLEAVRGQPIFARESRIEFARIQSAFAIALHMHQPLIPAGGDELSTAEIISNLKYMMDHPGIGDNHNAPVFHQCYKRMGEYIPRLVDEGREPRVMLEYSGTLLHGLRHMGLNDVFDHLKRITCEPRYRYAVEWLGCPWGHAVAPSTPVQNFRLHVQAWQHHFAAIFGMEALQRVRGFSPSEMALPNHPDTAYAFVKTLRDCGFGWVLVQEHSLGPMERASSHFFTKVLQPGIPTQEHRYRNALFHLLCSQTSCYRYWGFGTWTDYGREICRRLEAILAHDF